MLFNAAAALVLATAARAIQITAPTNTSGWTSGVKQTITWDSVSSDPKSFDIAVQIPNPASTETKTIATNVNTADGMYSYTPDSSFNGDDYRVNFVNPDNNAILAQSNYFEVKASDNAASASASASASTSSGASASGSASGTSEPTKASSTASSSASVSAVVPPSGTAGAPHSTNSVPNSKPTNGAGRSVGPSLVLIGSTLVALCVL